MTWQKKIDRLISYLTCSHLKYVGGYEHDHDIIGDTLVVARFDETKDNNRTKIDTYRIKPLIAWYDRAAKYLRNHGMSLEWPGDDYNFASWEEALEETRSEVEDLV